MKVMLVDDEPFILRGLSVLIDWKEEGFEIVKMASNGREALEYLRENSVDLVITDIKMPEMSGLELLEKVRAENLSEAGFIFLSGYDDFAYAQKALRCACLDYLLKPIKEETLLERLRTIQQEQTRNVQEREREKKVRESYLRQCMHDLLLGRQNEEQLAFAQEQLGPIDRPGRYILISLDDISSVEELSSAERQEIREAILTCAEEFLGKGARYLVREEQELEDYEVGFLYREDMAWSCGQKEDGFLESLAQHLNGKLPFQVVLLVGKQVEGLAKISKSYSSACALRSLRSFRLEKNVHYYEEEIQASANKVVLYKPQLDELIHWIEQNDVVQIRNGVDALYQEMEGQERDADITSMNINYLLFQLIHLATEQDESVDQEEVMSFLSDRVFESGLDRGSSEHLRKFACEYAEYLVQLRGSASRGVLAEVEKEVREHYAENLTLRDLSKKYYINSSYLGQLFRKKYGQSFKDYLTAYRIEEAASQLLRTDKKIGQIADDVGYHDTDYFISRFIEQKGCTPSKYRKNQGGMA
jgi:two-component system, response regulator YesN